MPLAKEEPLRPAGRFQRAAVALVAKPLFWAVFVLFMLAWPIIRSLRVELPPPLPVLGTLPDFQGLAADGKPYGAAKLRGRAWVTAFFFTRCAKECEPTAEALRKVQHRTRNLGGMFRIVSWSDDAEYDTPERLMDFARAHKASPFLWKFIAGVPAEVRAAVTAAFAAANKGATPEALFRGSHLLLVDGERRVRGFYPRDDLDGLLRDAGLLLNRGS
jgi:protein SCO1/2